MNILFVNACLRGEHSRTLKLAKTFLSSMNSSKNSAINELNVSDLKVSYLAQTDFDQDGETVYPYDGTLAKQFAQADHIVIAAPFWEFQFPAILNGYLEMISQAGITFQYTATGSQGLCKAQELTYIYTAGGYLAEGDKIGEMQLKLLSKLYGIPKFSAISLDGLDIDPSKADALLQDAISKIQ